MAQPSRVLALPTITDFFREMADRYGLSERASQRGLAEFTRDVLAAGGVGCAEAPTGTGKTLGYLAGALEQQAHAGVVEPIVVATATVALQEQIMRDDIPRLEEAGIIQRGSTVIAKGRGRYFCPRNAAHLEDKRLQDTQLSLLDTDTPKPAGGVPIALDMLKAWREKSWNGDQDDWQGPLPECWPEYCAATAESCVGRSCDDRALCPYYLSRERMAKASLVIANQDMVLADLHQRSEDPEKSALPFKRYRLVVDEAHNLPEKAVKTRKVVANLWDTEWLLALEGFSTVAWELPAVRRALVRADVSAELFTVRAAEIVNTLAALCKQWGALDFDKHGVKTWGQVAPDAAVTAGSSEVAAKLLPIVDALTVAITTLSKLLEEAVGADKGLYLKLLSQAHRFRKKAQELQGGLATFCFEDHLVRWLQRYRDGRLVLHAQPLEGAGVLTELLWQHEIPTVLVSASLQIAGSFKRFAAKSGLPAHTRYLVLPPVFDYSRGTLYLPNMAQEPGAPGYEAEVASQLDQLFDQVPSPGTLVLFTSRESMRRVMGACNDKVRRHAIIVDGIPVPEAVAKHKAAVDSGRRSLLVGLDSLSEGLDLPGKYCGHLVITRLPFGVPSDPVEVARQEALGSRWFEDAYLADMFTALIQGTGRLIRRETDHGLISMLDVRLKRRRYAMRAFGALPAFHRTPSLEGYFTYAKSRGFDISHGVEPREVSKPALTLIQGGVPKSKEAPEVSPPKPGMLREVPPCPPGAQPVQPVPAAETPTLALADQVQKLKATIASCKTVLGSATSTNAAIGLLAQLGLNYVRPATAYSEEFELLIAADGRPAIPLGAPVTAWLEAQSPEALALGAYYLRTRWNPCDVPEWQRLLLSRPDALQFASILQGHLSHNGDSRCALVSELDCREALEQIFHKDLPPADPLLLKVITEVETCLAGYFEQPHQRPSPALLSALIHLG